MIPFTALLSDGRVWSVLAFSVDEAWEKVEQRLFDESDFQTGIVDLYLKYGGNHKLKTDRSWNAEVEKLNQVHQQRSHHIPEVIAWN